MDKRPKSPTQPELEFPEPTLALIQPVWEPVILTGYKLATNLLERYTYPLPPIYRLALAMQRVLQIPIMFVEVEDEEDDEDSDLYVCCWVGSLDKASCGGTSAPAVFERVKEVLDVEGELKRRMFCPSARVYAVQEELE